MVKPRLPQKDQPRLFPSQGITKNLFLYLPLSLFTIGSSPMGVLCRHTAAFNVHIL